MAVDDFDTTVEQLYAGAPEDFVARRDAAVKSARADGDKDLAARIKQLRRPTAAAVLINRLRRSPDHTALDALLDLGERLRDAQSRLDPAAMKSLGAERNSLIAALLADVAALSGGPVSGQLREQLSDTLTAAVADADAARAVNSGRLVTGLRYSGFGEVDLQDAVAAPRADADEADRAAEAAEAQRLAARQGLAAQQRLNEARATLTAAQDAEHAAVQSAELAERALAAARHTAEQTRARAEQAAAARAAAEESLATAEAAATER
ncbi:hypothetical protein [Flexivirga sp. B27]